MKHIAALPIALALVIAPAVAFADAMVRFRGLVEPSKTVNVANHVKGVVRELRFSGGEDVTAGELLALIDPREFEIAVRSAQAALAEAEAALRLADDDRRRQAELLARSTGSRVAALRSDVSYEVAAAKRDMRRAELDGAKLALERARVHAPISGTISVPRVTEGAYVEAKAGTALAQIATLDPVRVAYQVTYAERSQAMAMAGVETPTELFERIELTLTLPSGEAYPHAGRPLAESATIDPATGALTVWGLFPNPDRTLVPFLAVSVTSSLRAQHDR